MLNNLYTILSTPASHYLQQLAQRFDEAQRECPTCVDDATSVLAHVAEFGLRAPNAAWNAQQVEFHKTLTESDVFAYELHFPT